MSERATPHVFPFTLIEAKAAARRQRNRGGGKTEEWEERQLSAKIKIRSRENKPVVTTLCYRLCAFILDEEVHKQRLPEKRERARSCDPGGDPARTGSGFQLLGLRGRNTRLALPQPALRRPLTCGDSSFPQLQSCSTFLKEISASRREPAKIILPGCFGLTSTCQRCVWLVSSEATPMLFFFFLSPASLGRRGGFERVSLPAVAQLDGKSSTPACTCCFNSFLQCHL